MNTLQQHSTSVNLSGQEIHEKQQLITLSTGATVFVPEGADPETFRKVEEATIRRRANPKRKRSRARRGTPKKSINYAEAVLWTRNGYTSVLEVA